MPFPFLLTPARQALALNVAPLFSFLRRAQQETKPGRTIQAEGEERTIQRPLSRTVYWLAMTHSKVARRPALRPIWKHLRLPFQLTLAPIFLWGYVLSEAPVRWSLLPAFVAFHLLLYPGITAYNSYYDRDEGPVGGVECPPPWSGSLLWVGCGLQLVGLLIAWFQGFTLLATYVAFMVLSVFYSHPSVRWKASPVLSVLVVCGGQGGLGFLAGWAAGRGEVGSALGVVGLLGATVAALTTLGMYPLTQIYQMEEDARRGDRTLCRALGVDRALRLSQVAFIGAGLSGVAVAYIRFTPVDAALLAGAFVLLIVLVERLRRQHASLTTREAFRCVLVSQYAASTALTLFICARLLRWH
jgi:4-hydroxybenzoate polyprenyltransferase